MNELIYKQDAIDALWKALYEYEDKTEKQFIDSEELDVADWIQHRNFVQNMSDIDRQTILGLPSAEPKIIHCKNCKHRESNDCPMYYEEWIEIDEGDGYFDTDNIIHDWTTDEGFCHCAELRGEEDE